MNKINFAFLCAVLVGFTGNIFCMKIPVYVDVPISEEWIDLSDVEKGMFLQLIDQEGIRSVSDILAQKKEPILADRGIIRKYTCFVVETEFTIYDEINREPFALLVRHTLNKNEVEPCLGKYTEWWKTFPGGQIAIRCIFNDKRVLQEVLNELRENK